MANPQNPKIDSITLSTDVINEANATDNLSISATFNEEMDPSSAPILAFSEAVTSLTLLSESWTDASTYEWIYTSADVNETALDLTISISGGSDLEDFPVEEFTSEIVLDIDTEAPEINLATIGSDIISEATVGSQVQLHIEFNEEMSVTAPSISYGSDNPTENTLLLSALQSGWTSNSTFTVDYDVQDADEEMENIQLTVTNVTDALGNTVSINQYVLSTIIDTKAPVISSSVLNTMLISQSTVGLGTFTIDVTLDEEISTSDTPVLTFPSEIPGAALLLDTDGSGITDANSYRFVFDCIDTDLELEDIDFNISNFKDALGNEGEVVQNNDQFSIDTFEPSVSFITSNLTVVSQSDEGAEMLTITVTFDQDLNINDLPSLEFINGDPSTVLALESVSFVTDNSVEFIYNVLDGELELEDIGIQITDFTDSAENTGTIYDQAEVLDIDTKAPSLVDLSFSNSLINESSVGTETFSISVNFDSALDLLVTPILEFDDTDILNSLTLNSANSSYTDDQTYTFVFDVTDEDFELEEVSFTINQIADIHGNEISEDLVTGSFSIDTKAAAILSTTPSADYVNEASVMDQFFIDVVIDESADINFEPIITFIDSEVENSLALNSVESEWTSETEYRFVFDITDVNAEITDVDFQVTGLLDLAQNESLANDIEDAFNIDTKAPSVITSNFNLNVISQQILGNDFVVTTVFDETMNNLPLELTFSPIAPNSLSVDPVSNWTETEINNLTYSISDQDEELLVTATLFGAEDLAGNQMEDFNLDQNLYIDNKAPEASISANVNDITETGEANFVITAEFDNDVSNALTPIISFPVENPEAQIQLNAVESGWDENTYVFSYNTTDLIPLGFIDIQLDNVEDTLQNSSSEFLVPDFFSIMLDTFLIVNELKYNELKVYPNPSYAGQEIRIDLTQAASYELGLTDALGRKIELPRVTVLTNEVILNTSGMPSGMYFMSVSRNGEFKAIRFEIIK